MREPDQVNDLSKAKMNLETSQIAWMELQRFFAAGDAISVASELDLVDVAYQFYRDNNAQVKQWMQENRISKVSDLQAMEWFETEAIVWAIVVKPWVLVQSVASAGENAD